MGGQTSTYRGMPRRTAASERGRGGRADRRRFRRLLMVVVATLTGAASTVVLGAPPVGAQEAPFQLNVNFGADNSPTPNGYVLDVGAPFGTGGTEYGWVDPADGTTPVDLRGGGRTRNQTALTGSLIHIGSEDLPDSGNGGGVSCSNQTTPSCSGRLVQNGAWEVAVPNGDYEITLGAGDADGGNDAEEHDILVEGVLIADGPRLSAPDQTGSTGASSYDGTVTVADGRLTLVQADTGYNSKPTHIEINQIVAGAPATPADFTAVTGSASGTAELTWTASPDATGYEILRDGVVVDTVTETTYTDGPIDSGTYAYAVAATNADGTSLPTDSVDVGVTYAACDDISTLDCAAVPVALPYTLDFTADAGGLVDGAGVGTGFTMVDAPSARLAEDGPAYDPGVPGYEPSLLTVDVANGQLDITSTAGIAYRNPGASSETNSQINTLGVGVDPTGGLIATTTIDAATFAASEGNNAQQGGIWFGLDETEFVKLVVAKQTGQARVQLAVETNDGAAAPGDNPEINSAVFPLDAPITLQLTVDPETDTVSASYAIASQNGGAPIAVDDGTASSIAIPETTTTLASPAPFAGIFTTNRRSDDPVDFAFSSFSVEAASAADETAPAVPANVVATAGDTTVAVSWDAVADTDGDLAGYNVYVDGVQANTEVVTGESYDATGLTNGTEYSFTVTSVDTTGNESAPSAAALATPEADVEPDETAPAVPANVTATAGDTVVDVAWDPVADTDGDLAGYDVYVDGVKTTAELVTETSYTVTGLTNGAEYAFTVTASDTTGNESAPSDAATATPEATSEPDDTAPAVPANVVATAGDTTVAVSWTAVADTDGDLAGYNVYVDGVQANTEVVTGESYDATGLTNGTEYSFTVTSVDTTGNESAASAAATATPEADPVDDGAGTINDFDGDGASDIGIFRTGRWFVVESASGDKTQTSFGRGGDLIVPGDYDGDAVTDLAIYRNGRWYVRQSSTDTTVLTQFGNSTDVPVPADYDGDGQTDFAVFRNGVWYVRQSTTGTTTITSFGRSSDLLVPADYDGDGAADIAIFRNGRWYVRQTTTGTTVLTTFGRSGDVAVPGDYDGDGAADIAIFRNGRWYVRQTTTGTTVLTTFGSSDDLPVVGDYDGDGATDLTVFRNGLWYVRQSSDGATSTSRLGASSDVVIGAARVPDQPATGTLSAAPSTVDFTVDEGTTDSEVVSISADQGSPTVNAAESADWLTVTAGADNTFTLEADGSVVAPGDYSTNVTFSASGYSDTVVAVTLTVDEVVTTLTADPETLDFTVEEGQSDTAQIAVTGDGETPLLTADEDSDWLDVVEVSQGLFDVDVDTTGLAVGDYEATITFTAPDYDDPAVVAVTLTVTAAPVEGCDPVSTLPCDALAVDTPYTLTFDGTEGGLADTGFTVVDAPSDRSSVDQSPAPAAPTFTDVPGYEPSLLTVDGDLVIDATKGIQYATPDPVGGQQTSGTPGLNAQLNGLGVPVEGGADSYELTTTVVAPNFNTGSGGSQQAGLWWFVDEDTYVKLVTVRVDNNNNRVQLAVESLDAPTSDDPDGFFELNGPTFANGQDVALRLVVDATSDTVTGFYTVADGTEQQVTDDNDSLVLPAALQDGVALDDGLAPTVSAGLFASKRSAPATASMSATFADFAVTSEIDDGNTAPEVLLTGDRTLFAGQETIIPVDTFDEEGDTVAVTVDGLPSGLTFDGDAISGTVDAAATANSPYTVSVTGDDGQETDTETFVVDVVPAVDLQVNFTTADGSNPEGYLRDFGQSFGERTGADQGTGLSYGWVAQGGSAPLDLTDNTRERGRAAIDDVLDTMIHAQYGDIGSYPGQTNTPNCSTNECDPGMWELAVPEGLYEVTVSVGDQPGSDSVYDSYHAVNVEGGLAVLAFQATADDEYREVIVEAGVQDGRLTIDAIGGNNTKFNYVEVRSLGTQPFVTQMIPPNRSTDVEIGSAVSASVNVPGTGVGVDPDRATSLTDENVKLFALTPDGEVEVDGNRGSTGGNDTIAFSAQPALEYDTTYRYVIDGVLDEAGNTFGRFQSVFTTETEPEEDPCIDNPDLPECEDETFSPVTGADFEKVLLPTASGDNGKFIASMEVHDGHLWYTTVGQGMFRHEILADGTLGPQQDLGVFAGRAAIGLVFDQDDPDLAWVTHATANLGNESARTGSKVSVVDFSDPGNPVVQDVIVNLPRSQKDHLSNSMIYGPTGDGGRDWLYFLQGSNQAAGDTDSAWGNRGETQLTAALLRFDPQRVLAEVAANGPINVATPEVGGTYDPYAPDAILEVYATGIRNAFDLVWHSNGQIYVPTNGTAAGGSSPGVVQQDGEWIMRSNDSRNAQTGYDQGTNVTDECTNHRADGVYTGGDVTAHTGLPTQLDYLFTIDDGGYYGHPNPTRCEWVMNNGSDSLSNTGSFYPAGTQADPNYDEDGVYNLGFNKSPNGVIEYQSETFGGELEGRLMIVRFSNNDDILTVQVAADGTILGEQPGTDIGGFSGGYADPLELIEDTSVNPGNLYLNQYNRAGEPQQLYLLRVPDGEQAATIDVDGNQAPAVGDALIMSATLNNEGPTDTQTVTVTNNGDAPTPVAASIGGANAAQFTIEDPGTIAAGASVDVDVVFDPTGSSAGVRTASFTFTSADDTVTLDVRALAHAGQEGGEEPTLQQVFDTFDFGLDSGWSGLAGGTNATPVGDEVAIDLFERAVDGPVIVTPVAAYAPFEDLPFGWYADTDGAATLNELGVLPNGQQQTLVPASNPVAPLEFDPGLDAFGLYYDSNTFNRVGYTEDARNTDGVSHRARIYPLPGDAFYVGFEDASNGDYQDYNFIIENVVEAGDDTPPPPPPPPSGDAIQVNFQSETASVPDGYLRDFGQPYGARTGADQGTGLTYGWVDDETFAPLDLVGNGRDRDSNDDQRLDTLMHMDLPPDSNGGTLADGSWEIALASGSYEVTVSVGDANNGSAPESHTINAEGVNLVDAFPKSGAAAGSDARHTTGSATVEVSDGRLTIDQIGGTNTKINYVEVVPLTGGGDVVAQVNFQPAGSATPTDWVADSGQLFAAGRGYGWVRTEGGNDKTADTRDRTSDSDPLTGTTMILDDAAVPAVVNGEWEYAIADGTYTVTVSVGDPDYADSTHGVSAEGQSVISGFTPSAAGDYGTGSATVDVSDGRLTLASTGQNTKIQWVQISSTGGGDVVPPQVGIALDGEGSNDTYTGPVTVSITINESNLEFVDVFVDGTQDTSINSTNYATPFEVSGAGDHTVEVVATDGSGNETTEQVDFTIIELAEGQLTLTNPEAAPFDDRLVMSRIQSTNSSPATNETATVRLGNSGSEPITVSALSIADGASFEIESAPALPFTIDVGENEPVVVLFDGVGSGANELLESVLTIESDAANGPATVVELAGQWQTQSEGGNEPNVEEIVEAFGFGTTIRNPGQQINNQGRLETIGDEVLTRTWTRANASAPVRVRQLAAYHTCCSNTASFRWHQVGNKGAQTTVLTHNGQWAQTLLPRIQGSGTSPAVTNFTPGPTEFSLRIDPESGDWTLNDTGPDSCGSGNAGCQLGHHLRVWPSEDRDGVRIPDQWIVVMDYSGINYDFNDNVYLVDNIRPATPEDTTAPAAPSNLTGELVDGEVVLDWDDVADDAEGYYVERSADENGPWNRLNSGIVTSSTFTDPNPLADQSAYRVLAADPSANESDPSNTVVVDTPDVAFDPIRVNAGGPAVTTGGIDYAADASGGRSYSNPNVTEIADTTDDVLYFTERSDNSADWGFDVAVPDGEYLVRLHFAEIYFGAPGGGVNNGGPGKRVFDIDLEGGPAEKADYDINAEVGPVTADIEEFVVTVSDGNLDIDFSASVNQPKLSAYEIISN